MAWINSQQPYIVPSAELYGQPNIFDYASVNAFQPTECCPQPSLYLPDYSQGFPQTLLNFPVPDFSQYIAAEQPLLENEHENDDESDTSSDYSVPSPGELPADSYFSSEREPCESINALLQRQNLTFKQEDEVYGFTPCDFERSAQAPNAEVAFATHPLFPTYIALKYLWNSAQEGLTTDFVCKAEPTMKLACDNLNSMGGAQYSGDSVIRYQISWLLDQLAELMIAVDSKADYSYGADVSSIDVAGPACGEFAGVPIDTSSVYPICSSGSTDADSESSSDDTVKEEFMPSKTSIKRKHDDRSDEDDEDEEDTEEDGDDEDFHSKRPMQKDVQKKRRENYAPDISFELFSWWFDNDGAAPNAQAKQELASKTGKTISQIATWYQNAKRRYSARLEDFRNLKAQHPHEVRDYGSYETFTRSQGSGSTTKRRRVQ